MTASAAGCSAATTSNHAHGERAGATTEPLRTEVGREVPALCTLTDADWATVLGTTRPSGATSPARVWNEMNLALIRRDVPMPGVHARNLYALSTALYEVWARFHGARTVVSLDLTPPAARDDAAVAQAIHYAGYRVLSYRYSLATLPQPLVACTQVLMDRLGLDPSHVELGNATAASFGSSVGDAVLSTQHGDGANERNHYADSTGFVSQNAPLEVAQEGTVMRFPSAWQPLKIAEQYTQNGVYVPEQVQGYIGAQWGQVLPFAMPEVDEAAVYHDVGRAPFAGTEEMNGCLTDLFARNGELAGVDTIDASPASKGHNALGANDGKGWDKNPVTGAPYAANPQHRGDFTQVLAEFWADGPNSETPPGHWNVLANTVGDSPGFATKLYGKGEPLPRLEWDVKVYFALNGALHDSAVAAWGLKRKYVSARPISLIRYAGQWQASNPDLPSYEPHGLLLAPGAVELVTRASAADPARHFRLKPGSIAVRVYDPNFRQFVWADAKRWVPFQLNTFVTPAFPGFASGHSTFSRAAARVLASLTGSDFFPGGLGKATFDLATRPIGPRRVGTVELQWATYFDAADEAGLSRIYGGIHINADDFAGRRLGDWVGERALEHVASLYVASGG